MQLRHGLIAVCGVLGLSALATAAAAGPTGNLNVSGRHSVVEQAAYRCRWLDGERVCRWYGPRTAYREHGFPENYRTGSRLWWDEMDRTERGGRRGR